MHDSTCAVGSIRFANWCISLLSVPSHRWAHNSNNCHQLRGTSFRCSFEPNNILWGLYPCPLTESELENISSRQTRLEKRRHLAMPSDSVVNFLEMREWNFGWYFPSPGAKCQKICPSRFFFRETSGQSLPGFLKMRGNVRPTIISCNLTIAYQMHGRVSQANGKEGSDHDIAHTAEGALVPRPFCDRICSFIMSLKPSIFSLNEKSPKGVCLWLGRLTAFRRIFTVQQF